MNRNLSGLIYILTNKDAGLVKVGMTTSSVEERCIDINRMWLGSKGTCQICGVRLLLKRFNHKRVLPEHPKTAARCPGGLELPLERSNLHAEKYLNELKEEVVTLTGSKKGSKTKAINTLSKRIIRFREMPKAVGVWTVGHTFKVNNVEYVEKKIHEKLNDYLESKYNFGEVFNCSVSHAYEAIIFTIEESSRG